MQKRFSLRLACLLTLTAATVPCLAQPQSLSISGLRQFYSPPYLLDFTFSVRDQDNHAVVLNPSQFQVVCKENGQAISQSESGYRLLSGDNKQLKCFLVLDYTRSMLDPDINGDIDGDFVSDSAEAMEAGAKAIIGTLHDDAQIGLFEFHRADAGFPPERVSSLTVDKAYLTNQINQIYSNVVWTSGSTRCWDALYLALSEFPDSNPADDQRFLVFLSDGKDESSTRTVSEVTSLAQSKGAKIYCIGYGQELAAASLQSITSQTGGQYYPAASVSELTQRFDQIVTDMGGQYVLRWTTLKRGSTSFTPSFDLTYAGQKATAAAGTYQPSSYEGNELMGHTIFDTSVSQGHVATLVLRATYIPRSITRLRLCFVTSKAFTVQPIPYAEGGVSPTNWVFTLSQTNGTGYCEFSSPNPANPFSALPFATLGKLVRFQLQGVTNLTQCFSEMTMDNSLYQQTGGQTFVIENVSEVSSPLTVLPLGTPVAWLAKYGITNNLIYSEGADLDGDGVPTWQEYLSDTNPTNGNSAFKFTNLDFGAIFQVTFNTEASMIYRLEYSDALSSWLALQTNIAGTGNPTNISDPTPTSSRTQRYYRVSATPALRQPDTNNLAWIKPGRFTMGSPSAEQDRYSDEGPQMQVTISQGFWMSKYEVTQGEYVAVMGTNPSYFTGDLDRPVEQVNWNDAVAYCNQLTQRERSAGRLPSGYGYRLPTEAEWEYACRAGTTTRFGYGDDPGYTQLGSYVWYNSNNGSTTHAVGVKKPNAWGLCDMHGNVWEWCLDWYGTYPGGSVTDPRGPTTGSSCVLRGGSWLDFGRRCRSAHRYYNSPDYGYRNVGFRAVLAPGQ